MRRKKIHVNRVLSVWRLPDDYRLCGMETASRGERKKLIRRLSNGRRFV